MINLTVPNGATITGVNIANAAGVTPTGLVINVNGDNLNFNGGSFNLGSLGDSQVLFNFGSATTINLSSLAFDGTLLAPLATVDFINGQLNGALIADNFIGSAQFNEVGFTGSLPTYAVSNTNGSAPAPEPGSLAGFAGGLLAIALAVRRRGRLVRI